MDCCNHHSVSPKTAVFYVSMLWTLIFDRTYELTKQWLLPRWYRAAYGRTAPGAAIAAPDMYGAAPGSNGLGKLQSQTSWTMWTVDAITVCKKHIFHHLSVYRCIYYIYMIVTCLCTHKMLWYTLNSRLTAQYSMFGDVFHPIGSTSMVIRVIYVHLWIWKEEVQLELTWCCKPICKSDCLQQRILH